MTHSHDLDVRQVIANRLIGCKSTRNSMRLSLVSLRAISYSSSRKSALFVDPVVAERGAVRYYAN